MRIEGNRQVSEEDLRTAAEVELKAFAAHGRPADADDAAWSMRRHLRGLGYQDAEVDLDLSGGMARFVVTEGARKVLSGVRLEGVRSIRRDDLMAYFDFGGEGFLGSGPVLYNEQLVAHGVEQVRREYRLRGFYDVEVDEPLVSESAGAKVTVTVRIREGRRYRVGRVRVNGALVPKHPCRTELEGSPFTRRSASTAAAIERERLMDRGHQFAKVKGEARPDRDAGTADIDVRADPGPLVRLRDVRVSGIENTSPRFVRRLVPLQRGAVLRQASVREAEENLFRAGIFCSACARVQRCGPVQADLHLRLKEHDPKSVEIDVGYGSYEQLRGAVRYRDRNLFGWGRYFEAEARGHLKGYGGQIAFRDPWLFGRKWTLDTRAGYERREEPSFAFQRLHFSAAAEYRPHRRWRFLGGYRFESQEAFDISADAPGADIDGFVTSAGLFIDASYDSRDSGILPTRGVLAEGGVFWSSPTLGADLSFFEQRLRGVWHQPIGPGVLAAGASFRVKQILNGDDALPIQERYFLGGDTTVRSFLESELGPVDPDGDPVGGLSSAQAHMEYRMPLGLGDLHGALFYELGVVNTDAWDFAGPFGHAVGAGLRYYLPFGPIRLDVGYGFGERFAAEDRVAVHLAIGFSF